MVNTKATNRKHHVPYYYIPYNCYLSEGSSAKSRLFRYKTDSSSAAYALNFQKLVIPAIAITYGVASLKVNNLKRFDFLVKDGVERQALKRTRLDNYAQYAPALLVYGLNAAGVKGKHSAKDRTIVYAASQLISAAFVLSIKHTVKEKRPDGSNLLSFPSGHTATAFSSAHFMFREYKDKNFWLAVSGYLFAAFTGTYRILNNKHWFSDVIGGAGFGILSTELAYFFYPGVSNLLAWKTKPGSAVIMPVAKNGAIGIAWIKRF
ncbi:MAG: phosphatase PAP2 family protein [Agriterribacter sp.]